MLSNVLAIIGFIILIVIVLWGLIHAASLSGGWFSSLFPESAPKIEVTAPNNAEHAVPFTISWKYDAPTSGVYAFLYQCQKGLQFGTPAPDGKGTTMIPCGAAFALTAGKNSLPLLPLYAGDAPANVPLSIVFIPSSNGSRVEGSATVSITPGGPLTAATSTKTTTTKTTTTTETSHPKPAPKAPVYTGPADLAVRIISANVDYAGNATVTFDIKNVGGTASGDYVFTAQLPTRIGAPYQSSVQVSLQPGDHVANTLHFNDITPGGGTFQVVADPANVIRESNENNNVAQTFISGGNSGGYNY